LNERPKLAALVAETRLTDIARPYREAVDDGSGVSLTTIAIVMAMIIVMAIAGYCLVRFQNPENTPLGLLHELCRVHGVKRSGRRLLDEIAIAAALPHPGIMFLGSHHFDAAVTAAKPKLNFDHDQLRCLENLRSQLFGRATPTA
jgi:hypothetical protein